MSDLDFAGLIDLQFDLGRASAVVVAQSAVAIAKTAYDIEADAKAGAPVDTGNLRSSITTTARGLHAEVGPTAEYGAFVEEGTSTQAPQPYLRPAAQKHTPGLVQLMGDIAGGIL